ncbi:hypothetical protein C882_3296 [Caenispirillum salinarum AK4]|uniref:Uncharacterized protein n=1 Tax=Caenispirillum salinarum AK4 TaxID=1238182 RepID=K9H3U9_9PROT|nr:hypothetical protein C882_3296 [Caenispirillum salinarum AK4]
MARRTDDRSARTEAAAPAPSAAPVRRARPVRHRLPEAELHRLKRDFAAIGLPLGPARVTADSLDNVCLAVFRLEGRLVCSHWRDDLTEVDHPALAGAVDVVALHADADARGLPRGAPARDAFLVYGIATALNAAVQALGLGGAVTVERFDSGTAPTRRDYLEGALFTPADHAAGRRPADLLPAGPDLPGVFVVVED